MKILDIFRDAERANDLKLGKITLDQHRSTKWPTVRKEFLEAHPVCAVCDIKQNLNVHHITPFHVNQDLELVDSNLITLCEAPARNHHLEFGHLYDWQSWNIAVVEDAALFEAKIKVRPYK